MRIKLSRREAQEKIEKSFSRDRFSAEEMRKIKRLAMKLNIKLGNYRKLFCKKCLSQLKGKIRITKKYKVIECESCGFLNRQGIKKLI